MTVPIIIYISKHNIFITGVLISRSSSSKFCLLDNNFKISQNIIHDSIDDYLYFKRDTWYIHNKYSNTFVILCIHISRENSFRYVIIYIWINFEYEKSHFWDERINELIRRNLLAIELNFSVTPALLATIRPMSLDPKAYTSSFIYSYRPREGWKFGCVLTRSTFLWQCI